MKKSKEAARFPKPDNPKFPWRHHDPTMSWITRDFRQLAPWSDLAIQWFATLKVPTSLDFHVGKFD